MRTGSRHNGLHWEKNSLNCILTQPAPRNETEKSILYFYSLLPYTRLLLLNHLLQLLSLPTLRHHPLEHPLFNAQQLTRRPELSRHTIAHD